MVNTNGRLGRQLRALGWFAVRPHLYREFMRTVVSRISSGQITLKQAARADAWCADRAISASEAVERLTGKPMPAPLQTHKAQDLSEAAKRAAECPVAMGGAGHIDLLYWTALHLRPKTVVETGIAYGWSSLAILLAQEDLGEGTLFSTDMPYVGRDNDSFVGCVVPERLRARWTIVRLPDRDGLPKVLEKSGPVDLCHYDSDKSYAGRMWAYPRLWASLRNGGVFLSDDVADNHAFREFAERLGLDPIVVKGERSYAGVLVKPS